MDNGAGAGAASNFPVPGREGSDGDTTGEWRTGDRWAFVTHLAPDVILKPKIYISDNECQESAEYSRCWQKL